MCNFKQIKLINVSSNSLWNCPQVNAVEPYWLQDILQLK